MKANNILSDDYVIEKKGSYLDGYLFYFDVAHCRHVKLYYDLAVKCDYNYSIHNNDICWSNDPATPLTEDLKVEIFNRIVDWSKTHWLRRNVPPGLKLVRGIPNEIYAKQVENRAQHNGWSSYWEDSKTLVVECPAGKMFYRFGQ